MRNLALFWLCLVACAPDTGPGDGTGARAGSSGQAGAEVAGRASGGSGAISGSTLTGGTSPSGGSNGGAGEPFGGARAESGTSGSALGGSGGEGGANLLGGSAGIVGLGGGGRGGSEGGTAGQSNAGTAGLSGGSSGGTGAGWVGTWTAAAQLTETANLPPAPGLSNNTLRQIFYSSIGGDRLRVHLSNEYGNGPVTLLAARLALARTGHGIDRTSERALAFSGNASATIPAGGKLTSDPVDFALPAQTKVALTIAFGATPSNVTGHPGSRTNSYIATGNAVSAENLPSPVTTAHWYYATGIDVAAEAPTAAVITFGDSITDGRGSTTDGNDRWPDFLSRRLRANAPTARVAVLNMGMGGNALFSEGGNGPTGASRFERDVLNPAGARWAILLHGVNDIGMAANAGVAAQLIDTYGQLVSAARAKGIRIYGVPILPFEGSQYDTPEREMARQTVNAWIRAPGNFDAVLELEAAVRDPSRPTRLLPAYDDGDGLHLNPAGYAKMADAVDLSLFLP
ncbi:MAG TPA: SGNH/GDSL hydrolase family protein [Polyangiaceae bacterium]